MKKRTKKYFAPIIATVFLAAYLIGILIFFFASSLGGSVPFVIKALFIGTGALGLVGVIFALVTRIKEIKGGEEDVASKY